jgi:hypothetical protein
MLNKLNLAVHKMAANDRVVRNDAVRAINISAEATEATNGSLLVRVSRPAPGEALGLLDAKDAGAFAKIMGGSHSLYSHPHTIEASRADDGGITLSTRGDYLGDKDRSITFAQPPGTWPPTESTVAACREKETLAQVTLSVKFLKALVDLLAAAEAHAVRIRLTDPKGDPCEFHASSLATGQNIYALIAPMRSDTADFDASLPPARKETEAVKKAEE